MLYRFVAQALGKAYPSGVHGAVTMANPITMALYILTLTLPLLTLTLTL